MTYTGFVLFLQRPGLGYLIFLSATLEAMRLARIKSFVHKHAEYISPAVFLFGFVIDNLTLTRIDVLFDNLVLAFYVIVATVSIVLLNVLAAGAWRFKHSDRLLYFLPFILQFAFGGLFSGFFVFYSRSSSFASSWLFVVLLVGFLIANEFFDGFKRHYQRLTFQLTILFLGIFSYMIFLVPVITTKIGTGIFILSGLVALLLFVLLVRGLAHIIPHRIETSRRSIMVGVGSVYIAINALYFLNVIPPIPLSLKDIGVYHNVTRLSDGTYRAHEEVRPWYDFFFTYDRTIEWTGGAVYVFASVFAPTDLTTTVFHEWQFKNTHGNWETRSKIPIRLSGGRDNGYRGYTLKGSLEAGDWRVRIVTSNGGIVGQARFDIVRAAAQPELVTLEK